MLLARLVVSVDERELHPDSGSAMINLSSVALPAAIAVAVPSSRPADVPSRARAAPTATRKRLERRMVLLEWSAFMAPP
jgi:hypothetical protein